MNLAPDRYRRIATKPPIIDQGVPMTESQINAAIRDLQAVPAPAQWEVDRLAFLRGQLQPKGKA